MIELPEDKKTRAIILAKALTKKVLGNSISRYIPHAKQLLAHAMGAINSIGAVFGGNRTGKSMCAGCETTYHLTGIYPDWWNGRRFKRATKCWVGSKSIKLTRDGAQRLLLGPPGQWGTGLIPADCIESVNRNAGSVRDAVDTVRVKHAGGGVSELTFKAYEQGRENWQAVAMDFIWMDEEPPEDIMKEAMMRVMDRNGYLLLAFTPLMGMSNVCMIFLADDKPKEIAFVNFSWADNPYLAPETIDRLESQMSPHEREARQHGQPTHGSGLIFPVTDELLLCEPFEIPPHWTRGAGLDVGWTHPTAISWDAHDAQTDTIYHYDEYRVCEQPPLYHAAAIKARGIIPLFPDPAANQSSQKDGEKIIELYRAELPGWVIELADNAVEAGLHDMFQRMITGRYKVFKTCGLFMEEKRLYHRDEKGQVVKQRDDILCAARYNLSKLAEWRPLQTQHFNLHHRNQSNVDGKYGGS